MTENSAKLIDLIKELESIKTAITDAVKIQQEQIKESDKTIEIYKDWLRDCIKNKTDVNEATEIVSFAKSQGIKL